MSIRHLLSAVLLLCAAPAFAQVDANTARNNVIIKFSPLALFDGDNTVQFGVEVPIRNTRFSLQEDLGYGTSDFSIWYSGSVDRPSKSTFKSRTQLRYNYYGGAHFKAYVAGEFMYKRVLYRENEWVGMDCVYGDCGYFQNMPVRIERTVSAYHPRLGWQFYFSSRLTLDLFLGVGLRHVRVTRPGLPDGRYAFSSIDELWPTTPRNETIASAVLGFNFGLILGKIKNTTSPSSF